MKNLYKILKERNSIWKFNVIKPYIVDGERILDFGCGDMGLSIQIVRNFKKINATCVDLIPLKKTFAKKSRVSFTKYDGKKLPFKNGTFDTIIAFYVFHHCDDPVAAIKECVRVSKKRILVVESIPHKNYELPFMRFFDWFFNVLKFDMTPLPYKFHTLPKWKNIFRQFKVKNTFSIHPKSYEDYLPFGKIYVLEFVKLSKKF